MEDKDLVTLTETAERSKSNTKQITELKENFKETTNEIYEDIKETREEIKEVRNDQKAFNKIASNIEIIANNMQNLKEGLEEVKDGQQKLSAKMDNQIVDVRAEQRALENKIEEVKNAKGKKLVRTGEAVWEHILKGLSWAGIAYLLAQLFQK